MLSKRGAIAVGAVAALVVTQAPARSNPAAAAALPAACATGVGCVLVGTVLVGGTIYYLWQHRRTGERYQIPASASVTTDQETWRDWYPRGEVYVTEPRLCVRMAQRYGVRLLGVRPSPGGELGWVCIFPDSDED